MPSQSYLQRQANKAARANQSMLNEINQALEPQANEVIVQKNTASAVVNGVERNTVSLAKNVNSSAISSAMKIDTELEKGILGTLLGNTIKITVNNTSAADITCPKNAHQMITSLTILTNGGTDTLCSLTKEALMYPLRFLDTATLTRYKRGYESDAAEVIAAGASRSWYIPILSDPFAINEIFMRAVKGVVLYKIEFDTSAWVGGAESYPALTGLSIISRHLYYSAEWMDKLEAQMLASNKTYNFRSYIVKNIVKTITASGDVNVNLDGFTEKASEMFLQLWQNGQHLEDLGNYIDTYNITDANNTSFIASGPIDSTYDDVILSAVHSYEPVIGATSDPWVAISLSPDMTTDFLTGKVHGHRQFTGKEILKLVIKSTLPDTDYQLRIYYGKLDKMRSVGGKFTLSN